MASAATAPGTPVEGQFYYDTADNALYWWNGASWVLATGTTELSTAHLRSGLYILRTERGVHRFMVP